jgi:hypothetical protein
MSSDKKYEETSGVGKLDFPQTNPPLERLHEQVYQFITIYAGNL